MLQFQFLVRSPLKSPTGHYRWYVACKWARSPVLTWQPSRPGCGLCRSMCREDERKMDLPTPTYILREDFQRSAKAPTSLRWPLLETYYSNAFLLNKKFVWLDSFLFLWIWVTGLGQGLWDDHGAVFSVSPLPSWWRHCESQMCLPDPLFLVSLFQNTPSVQFSPVQFSSVQSLSRVQLFATPWITALQASLSITNSRSSLRLTSIESVMPSSHLILLPPSLPAPNPLQHQSLFQWVNSSHKVVKVLEFQL